MASFKKKFKKIAKTAFKLTPVGGLINLLQGGGSRRGGGGGESPVDATPEVLRGELEAEQQALETLPSRIRALTEAESKRAGTFAPTPEFAVGLESESAARERGAKVEGQRRIEAIKRRLGLV